MAKKTKSESDRERVDLVSADVNADRIEALKSLFPEAFAEGKVDFDKLKVALGETIDGQPERYTFSWAGKSEAIRILQTPTRATLKPCKEESVDWDSTKNLFLEGDNLEVLKLLYKSYFGRVKMIYIDPPYNTGNDFVYPDNYADPLATYLQLTGQQDAEGNLLTSNPETSGRYHSSWLSMMYPRLFIARQLLREDGVIFVSIDDTEVHNLRMMMNEIFGEENFIATICWQKKYAPANDRVDLSDSHDFVLAYLRQRQRSDTGKAVAVLRRLERSEEMNKPYKNPDNDLRGEWRPDNYLCNKSAEERPNLYYPIIHPKTGEDILPKRSSVWRYSQEEHERHVRENRVWWGLNQENKVPAYKRFLSDVPGMLPTTWWAFGDVGHTDEARKETNALLPGMGRGFETPKPVRLLKRIVDLATSEEPTEHQDIFLDFFSGTCTTAQAVMELSVEDGRSRQAIMVQLPERLNEVQELEDGTKLATIADIGKERLRRVIAKIRAEREEKTKEANGGLFKGQEDKQAELDLGFRVYKLAESTHRPWQHTRRAEGEEFARYQMRLEEQLDPILEGSHPDDILWEVALKEGYSLSSRVESLGDTAEVRPRKKGEPHPRSTSPFTMLFRITDEDKGQSFLICLDDAITLSKAKALELKKDDLFVCRDKAITDEVAANLALQCRLKTI